MIKVEICKEPQRWDDFVHSQPHASNYHRWVWRSAIEDTFGHVPYYVAATEDNVIQGVLPLFFIKSWLFGRSLVSVPFFSYGGVLARTEAARLSLAAKTVEIASELGVRHVELRHNDEHAGMSGWHASAAKVTMEVPLPATADELWKRLSTGLRNKVRNGRKNDFRISWGGLDDVAHFYSVFAVNMRNLGTPVYPREWFENLCRCSAGQAHILTLWDGDNAVASAFLNAHNRTLELPWSASLPESRKKYSQVFLYWTFLEWAVEHGFDRVDLGRCTPGGGTYEFKRHWGCTERMLHWYHWLPAGAPIPELKPDNGRFRLAVKLWKQLPMPIANGLGPHIVRSIP